MPFDDQPRGGGGHDPHDDNFLEQMSLLLQAQMVHKISEYGGCITCTMAYTAAQILSTAVAMAEIKGGKEEGDKYLKTAVDCVTSLSEEKRKNLGDKEQLLEQVKDIVELLKKLNGGKDTQH